MKFTIFTSVVMVAVGLMATPVMAQSSDDSWTGGYIGVHGGYRFQPNDKKETIQFDTNKDKKFGDTVAAATAAATATATTATTTNIFSPGFCGGAAKTNAPVDKCKDDKNKMDFGIHAGYDYQMGNMVVGVVGEYSFTGITDSVSAFSTTPASYTLTRKLQRAAGLRLRAGVATGDTLFYVTGGGAYGKIKNGFKPNAVAGVNEYKTNGNDNAWGYKLGAGVEHKLGGGLSLGLQYMYTSLKDKGYRVNVSGGAFTNDGVDMRRSDSKFNSSVAQVTINYRF